jgi:hypothetical protein
VTIAEDRVRTFLGCKVVDEQDQLLEYAIVFLAGCDFEIRGPVRFANLPLGEHRVFVATKGRRAAMATIRITAKRTEWKLTPPLR